MPRYTQSEQDEARKTLLAYLPKGSTVSLVLTSVSRSGMSRTIKVLATNPMTKNVDDVSWFVSRLLNLKLVENPSRSVRVVGGGMDMGLHLVDALSRSLHDLSAYGYGADGVKKALRCSWL